MIIGMVVIVAKLSIVGQGAGRMAKTNLFWFQSGEFNHIIADAFVMVKMRFCSNKSVRSTKLMSA